MFHMDIFFIISFSNNPFFSVPSTLHRNSVTMEGFAPVWTTWWVLFIFLVLHSSDKIIYVHVLYLILMCGLFLQNRYREDHAGQSCSHRV